MTLLVECPNGHRFPVNLKKHRNRRERYCPRCNAEVKIKGRFGRFLPNPNWPHQRAEQTWQRTRIKEMRRPREERATPSIRQLPFLDLLQASILVKRQMNKKEEEKQIGS